jgi:Domain of unknown function (DUF4399)
VQFGLSGMGVAPASVDKPSTGHHHLLIDVHDALDPNEPIPQDKPHLHFGVALRRRKAAKIVQRGLPSACEPKEIPILQH